MADEMTWFEEDWELLEGQYRLEWRESWGAVTLSIVRAEDGKTLDSMRFFEMRVINPYLREADLEELRGKLEGLQERNPSDVELLMDVVYQMGYEACKEDNEVY